MLDWQVIFFDNAPTWQWGAQVRLMDSPFGQVRYLPCTTVVPVQNGFLEVRLAEANSPEMTFLVRADHVLAARSVKEPSSLGFGAPANAPTSQQQSQPNSSVPPSQPADDAMR